MKSKKALELIECEHFEGTTMNFSSVKIFARTAVEEAEQEMMEKAVEAFKRLGLDVLEKQGILTFEECCLKLDEFINQLNNK